MPNAAPHVCSGCGVKVTVGRGKCSKCSKCSNWEGRGTRHDRGYGVKWERIRKVVIKRDKGLCQPCFRNGFIKRFDQVDHRKQKADGGTDDIGNLECICNECHRIKTAKESN